MAGLAVDPSDQLRAHIKIGLCLTNTTNIVLKNLPIRVLAIGMP